MKMLAKIMGQIIVVVLMVFLFSTVVNVAMAMAEKPSVSDESPPAKEEGMRESGGCRTAGCSSQLCVTAEEAMMIMSTCEWIESYACYRDYGQCGRRANGECGWAETPELVNCLANPSAIE